MNKLGIKEGGHNRRRCFAVILLVLGCILSCFTPAASFAIGPDDHDDISGLLDPITAIYPYYGFVENPDHPWEAVWDALDSTGTINYSDSYFDTPSPGNHPELRAVSYALALAGFENEVDGYPSDSSTLNPKLQLFLDQLGFSNYQKWDTASDEDGHSMGTTIARKTLSNGQTLIVVAPRNYNYMTEWLSNFNVGTSGDHAGFSESAGYIKERLDEYIYTNHLSDYKIWFRIKFESLCLYMYTSELARHQHWIVFLRYNLDLSRVFGMVQTLIHNRVSISTRLLPLIGKSSGFVPTCTCDIIWKWTTSLYH